MRLIENAARNLDYATLRGGASDYGFSPEVHPNGFIQLALNRERTARLHVWHSELPRQTVRTAIHDHIFDMYVTVLKGRMTNIAYWLELDPEGEYEVHQALAKQCTETNLTTTGHRVELRKEASYVIHEGASYSMSAGSFHDSIADDNTITLMEKRKFYPTTARVLVPVGAEPDNEFSRVEHNEDELWNYIRNAFEA